MNPFTLRELSTEAGGADLAALYEVDMAAFGYDLPEDFRTELTQPEIDTMTVIGCFDGAELVSAGAFRPNLLTLPGPRQAPVASVTWVGVRPGYRRRGLLRRMMTHQLTDLHEKSERALAILTASESGIYGRFGYGQAISRMRLTVPRGSTLRMPASGTAVREVPRAIALDGIRELYERVAPGQPGFLDRAPSTWPLLTNDHAEIRRGASTLRFAVHPDGYACYRWKDNWTDRGPRHTVEVTELITATPQARTDLWDYLLNLDLAGEISYRMAGVDETLQDLLTDPRALQAQICDLVWLRIVDLDRAVGLRTYSADARVRVGVTDTICPWNDGTWELDLSTAGGQATRTDREPEIELSAADLAAAFLGGTAVARLRAAGLVGGDPEAVARLSLALRTPTAPWCPESF